MKTENVSDEQLTGFLQDGDVLINLGLEAIAASAPAVSINADGSARIIDGPAYPLSATSAEAVANISTDQVARFVLRGSENDCQLFAQTLEATGHHCVACVTEAACAADAFMDDEDSEAVAERLRQLGYL
jgi:hypothetical protein